MRNRMYGGVRGRKTKVGRKLLRFPPTRLLLLSLREEEELIWLFSSISLLLLFLRKPDELEFDTFFRYRIDLHRFY